MMEFDPFDNGDREPVSDLSQASIVCLSPMAWCATALLPITRARKQSHASSIACSSAARFASPETSISVPIPRWNAARGFRRRRARFGPLPAIGGSAGRRRLAERLDAQASALTRAQARRRCLGRRRCTWLQARAGLSHGPTEGLRCRRCAHRTCLADGRAR